MISMGPIWLNKGLKLNEMNNLNSAIDKKQQQRGQF